LRNDTGQAYFAGNVTVGNVITNGNLGNNVVNYNNIVPGVVPVPAGTNFVPTSVFLPSGDTTKYAVITNNGWSANLAYTKVFISQDRFNAGGTISLSGTYSASVVSNSYQLNSIFFGVFVNDKRFGGMDNAFYNAAQGTAGTGSIINNGGQLVGGPFRNNTSFSGVISTSFVITIDVNSTNITPDANVVVGVFLVNASGSFPSYTAAGNFTFSNQQWSTLYV
jgi:hypothetical protein